MCIIFISVIEPTTWCYLLITPTSKIISNCTTVVRVQVRLPMMRSLRHVKLLTLSTITYLMCSRDWICFCNIKRFLSLHQSAGYSTPWWLAIFAVEAHISKQGDMVLAVVCQQLQINHRALGSTSVLVLEIWPVQTAWVSQSWEKKSRIQLWREVTKPNKLFCCGY